MELGSIFYLSEISFGIFMGSIYLDVFNLPEIFNAHFAAIRDDDKELWWLYTLFGCWTGNSSGDGQNC